jgi:hypothetical protein
MRLNTKSLRALRAAISVVGVAASFDIPSAAQAFWGTFDGGGRVGEYLDFVSAANISGEKIEIGGICASACTMKLGARNVCIRSDAELWFHAARDEDGQINGLATLMIKLEYPMRIRAWANSSGALNTTAFTTMSGAQAIALGVPDCDRGTTARSVYTPTDAFASQDNAAKICNAEPFAAASGAAACFKQPQASFASAARASNVQFKSVSSDGEAGASHSQWGR